MQKLKMDRAQVTKLVRSAVSRLVEEQPALLNLDVTERSLSHHVAVYLAESVPSSLDVDVEYNRHGADPKRLRLPRRTALDSELRATTVFPDIIIHKRNRDTANLLVLEVKKPGEPLDYDELKLKAFRRELRYQHTGHLILGRNGKGKIVRRLKWLDA
jgi:hypothetical protein